MSQTVTAQEVTARAVRSQAVADAEERTGYRFDGARWARFVFPGIWLVYLGQTISGVQKHSHGMAALAAYLILAAFALAYLIALPQGWHGNHNRYWVIIGVMCALVAAEAVFAHQDALVMCVYLAVLMVGGTGRFGLYAVLGLTVIATVMPALIPSWHAGLDTDMTLTIPLVGLAMWGFFNVIRSNIELAAARAEVARLAAENERTRIARDLHDLLGHSLTTITIKAALAARLADRDPVRAAREIAEVEALSRQSLADVRAAVSGYRDVSLAGELATSGEVLRAAGIDADLPGAVDVVAPAYQEVLGWVLREAMTNVVRHSHARRCVVTLGPNWIEIRDDGRPGSGVAAAAGHGLTGLTERVTALGGTVRSGMSDDGLGWRVRADLPSCPAAVSPDCAEAGRMFG
jgi:two-component system sensor histidine kinase DesK